MVSATPAPSPSSCLLAQGLRVSTSALSSRSPFQQLPHHTVKCPSLLLWNRTGSPLLWERSSVLRRLGPLRHKSVAHLSSGSQKLLLQQLDWGVGKWQKRGQAPLTLKSNQVCTNQNWTTVNKNDLAAQNIATRGKKTGGPRLTFLRGVDVLRTTGVVTPLACVTSNLTDRHGLHTTRNRSLRKRHLLANSAHTQKWPPLTLAVSKRGCGALQRS